MNTKNDIDWQFIELKRTKWEGNDDPTREHPLTFAAHSKTMELLDGLWMHMVAFPPGQDVKEFRINDKTDGEISLEWHGPLFELDVDISADGKISFLLCRPQSDRQDWISMSDASVDEVLEALENINAFVE